MSETKKRNAEEQQVPYMSAAQRKKMRIEELTKKRKEAGLSAASLANNEKLRY
eukprot:Pgem_evm1s14362